MQVSDKWVQMSELNGVLPEGDLGCLIEVPGRGLSYLLDSAG